ncbi:kyphoscoliosis peptidase [Elysia marginata]|uniref:Kyphoscoliosis peptidase n=1 Tax=Elysia marginata TaxID=1093978 RepID=A0AAV4IXU1_9GAST|nr:kyphoscoliosis peptidase [Elysia marginata]
MRKISLFDAQTVPIRSAQVAKRTLKPYDKDQIRDVSAGAATFYIWALGMVEEVESYGGAEQADQMRLKK